MASTTAKIVINKADGEVVSILAVIDEPGAKEPAALVKSTERNAPSLYHSSRNWGLAFVQELEKSGVLKRDHGVSGPSIMVAIPGIPGFMKGQENDRGLHVSIYNKPAPAKGAGKGAELDYSVTGGPIRVDTHAEQLAALDGKSIQISFKMDSIKLLTGGKNNDLTVGCPFYVAVDVAEETQQLITDERAFLNLPSTGYVGHLSVAGLAPGWVALSGSGADEQKAIEEDFTVFRDGDGHDFEGWHTDKWRTYFVEQPKNAPPAEKTLVAPSSESQLAVVKKRQTPSMDQAKKKQKLGESDQVA